MTIEIVAVHPATTVIRHDDQQSEIPTSWFPDPPVAGQVWDLTFTHEPTDTEKLATLNSYLTRD